MAASALARHRVLAPTAAVKVSPLCLGAMNFGEAWKERLGECSKETSFEMLDYFYEKGGNFIDTANNYQDEESETWIGEWLETRGVRDDIVLATKYTSGYRSHAPKGIKSNYTGNNSKSMRVSVEASLKKLRTDYIDLLYVHWWDLHTSIEEVMQSLNQLVAAGKVIYLGISDTPAWIVSRANQYARDHGLRGFSVYQGKWSAAIRDFERDIIPMCQAEGMGIAPWGALGGGKFKTEAQWAANEGRKIAATETERQVSAALERVAGRRHTIVTSVALAYVMHKVPHVFPIVGGRKVEHLEGNIAALTLRLTDEDIADIEAAYPFEIGFPLSMLLGSQQPKTISHPSEVPYLQRASASVKSGSEFDWVEHQRPILPKEQ